MQRTYTQRRKPLPQSYLQFRSKNGWQRYAAEHDTRPSRFRAQQSADNGIISGPWEQGPAVSDAIIYDADGKAIARMDKVTRERKPL